MNQHLTVQQLSSALDGALLGPSLEVVVRHLAVCADCRERQSRLVRHDDVLRRLLSPEVDESFLDALGSRAEDIAVAITRGVPPPAMATTVPLLHEEDPYQSGEPPMDPSLGVERLVAQEGGYGRIGMKPTGSTHPPEADPAEAQRWLEALENGQTADPNTFTMPPRHPSEGESSAYGLPQWLEEPAPGPHAPSAPREPQHLRLVPTPDETPMAYGDPLEADPAYADPMDEYAEADPYAYRSPIPQDPHTPRTLMPMSLDPYGQRITEPEPSYVPPNWVPPRHVPPAHPSSSASAYAQAPRTEHEEPAGDALQSGYATRESAIAASRRLELDEKRARALQRHWLIAGASVFVLLLIVLALQLVPAARLKPAAPSEPSPAHAPDLSSASSRPPVEEVVPPPQEAPADSGEVAPEDAPEDTSSVEP